MIFWRGGATEYTLGHLLLGLLGKWGGGAGEVSSLGVTGL